MSSILTTTLLLAPSPRIEAAVGKLETQSGRNGSIPGGTAWREVHLESFDQIWTTVQETYWDPEIGGIDWAAARSELRPLVQSAASPAEARQVMRELIARLGQSHFALISSELTPDLAGREAGSGSVGPETTPGEAGPAGEPEDGPSGTTGLDLRAVGGEALVVSVEPGSAAAEAGVEPGWRLDAIDGNTVDSIITGIEESMPGSTGVALLTAVALQSRLHGTVAEPRSVRLTDGAGKVHEVALRLGPPRDPLASLGHLPPIPTHIEWRIIEDHGNPRRPEQDRTGMDDAGTVGYIAFSAFLDPGRLMREYGAAMTTFIDEGVSGVVLDLRGNPGGIGAMAMGMAGWLVAERGLRLGTMTTRETSLDFVIFPRPKTWKGPVAILVDGLSASTSEILAAGLQDLGRARVFGSTTAGMALPSQIDRLPNGDAFQHAFADYESSSGIRLEGRGVIPDHLVPLRRDDLLAGSDAALEAAAQWLLNPTTPDPKAESTPKGLKEGAS